MAGVSRFKCGGEKVLHCVWLLEGYDAWIFQVAPVEVSGGGFGFVRPALEIFGGRVATEANRK